MLKNEFFFQNLGSELEHVVPWVQPGRVSRIRGPPARDAFLLQAAALPGFAWPREMPRGVPPSYTRQLSEVFTRAPPVFIYYSGSILVLFIALVFLLLHYHAHSEQKAPHAKDLVENGTLHTF